MTRRVAVTGAGAISALGNSWPQVKASILAGKNKIRYMSEWDIYPELQTRLASPVDAFTLPEHFSIKKTRGMGRVAQLAVCATEQALIDAGLHKHDILKSGQAGVAYGSATGSSAAAMEFFNLLENHSMSRIKGTTYLRMMAHTAAINISVYFGTSGRMFTTSSACTAGSQGIGAAYEAIKNGQQKVMIAGGAEELCPTQAAVFDTVYATSTKNEAPESSPRPFDQDRDGMVLGEGACTLILEDWDYACERGANIIAEVIGYGTNTDGTHLVRPNKKTMAEVMRLALSDAKLAAQDVDYISGHGTASIHGDIAESEATHEVMGAEVPFSVLKSFIGHSLGACAALEAWVGIECMRESWMHPTLNLDKVDERCAPLNHIKRSPIEKTINNFMCNNFAFGGVNTSLIFRKV